LTKERRTIGHLDADYDGYNKQHRP